MVRQRFISLLAVLLGSIAYNLATMFAANLLWTPPPAWWDLPISKLLASYVWLHSVHLVALVLASLPFAIALLASRLPKAVTHAWAITTLGVVVPLLMSIYPMFGDGNARFWVSTSLDLFKFFTVLPALTWLLALVWDRRPWSGESSSLG